MKKKKEVMKKEKEEKEKKTMEAKIERVKGFRWRINNLTKRQIGRNVEPFSGDKRLILRQRTV